MQKSRTSKQQKRDSEPAAREKPKKDDPIKQIEKVRIGEEKMEIERATEIPKHEIETRNKTKAKVFKTAHDLIQKNKNKYVLFSELHKALPGMEP